MLSRTPAVAAALLAGLLCPTAARAFPWDIDMVDAAFMRAYEWEMMHPPEGAIPTAGPYAAAREPVRPIAHRTIYREDCAPSCKAPTERSPMWSRDAPEGVALTNPLAVNGQATDEVVRTGAYMFDAYCAACHGNQGMGNAPVADINVPGRYPAGPPKLAGEGNSSRTRTDGYIYLTIRNGTAIMPSYSYAMSDEEMWAVVAYIRTLPLAQYSGS